MALDRGTLAKIDRAVFAELDHAEVTQAVKVPLSDAVWSTWRRYCEALALSMGDGVGGLIIHELRTVVAEAFDGDAVFAERAERQAQAREARLDAREWELDVLEERLRATEERLRTGEGQLQVWEQRIREEGSRRGQFHGRPKVGRNERCPCGSGLKYKHCHGLPGRT